MKKEKVFLGGAVFAAIASSLCCVLPVLAIVFGVGAFGVASVFESFRPYLLAFALVALAFSFYRVYFRRERCAEDDACATKPVNRLSQLFLWAGVLAVTAFAFAPYYTGYIVSAVTSAKPSSTNATNTVTADESGSQTNKTAVIAVEGMTCAGCEPHINETLTALNGVVSSEASYQNKNVKVVFNPKQITLEEIKRAIDEIGYKAK